MSVLPRSRIYNGVYRPTSREFRIMIDLFNKKVMTYEQIQRNHYPNVTMTNVRRTMKRLKVAGYVTTFSLFESRKELRVFTLTKKSKNLVCLEHPLDIETFKFQSDSVIHDLRLGEICDKIKEGPEIEDFYTENALQSGDFAYEDFNASDFKVLNSDSAFTLVKKGEGYPVALEYERSQKNKLRYKEKLLEYLSCSDITAVLYVCEKRSTVNAIHDIAKNIIDKDSSKFFTCYFDDFIKAESSICLEDFKGEKVEIIFAKEKFSPASRVLEL